MKSIIAAAGVVALAQAFTQPGAQTYGSLLTPNTGSPVTTGQDYTVTWSPNTPADGVTVSLVLCNGPGANCVLQSAAIVEGVPAGQGSYTWSVPCSLPEGVQSTETGYGMLIIVDGTGEFQYSTQFSVQKGSTCGSSGTTTTSSSSSSPTTTTSSDSSSSAAPTSPSSSTWNSWESSTLSTSTVPVPTTPAQQTTVPAVPTVPTTTYSPVSTPAVATSATPKPYTGAAAVPTAFANAAAMIGAAALAMLAL